jgi:ketosteroid isomerase-like protein
MTARTTPISLFVAVAVAVAVTVPLSLATSGCAATPSCPQTPAAAPPTATLVVGLSPAAPLTAAGAVDAPAAAMTDDMTKASATLDRFHAAAAAADEATYFSLFAEGGVFLGTDGKERWTVPEFRAYAHPRFAAGKAWAFRATRRDLSVRGDVAWFDEDLATPNLGPARGSGALLRDAQGAWKVVQYNLSIPIPNERFADVKKVIEGGGLPCKPKGKDPGY